MELCTCPSCKKFTVTDSNGNIHQGLFVHRSTRNKHWAKFSNEAAENTISRLLPQLSFNKPSEKKTSPHENEESDPVDVEELGSTKDSEINSLIMKFILWLYLACGLSKANCRKARDHVMKIIEVLSQKNNTNCHFVDTIPLDIRTMIKRLNLEVSFDEFVCCPLCFSLYDVEVAPEDCKYQATPSSDRCGTELFKSRHFFKNPLIEVLESSSNVTLLKKKRCLIQLPGQLRLKDPHSTFVTQDFTEWLTWFINVPGIEDSIENWKNELSSQDGDTVCDVAQGQVWKKLFCNGSSGSRLNLGFSLFIDWFNPLGNKLAGRQLSIGIITLNCLNLPLWLRYQTRNTCLSGVIPGPNQPDMITINNVLTPLIDQFLKLNQGITVCTPRYPNGRKLLVKLVTLVGDIVATHKVAGFMSHSATKFCSWCEIKASERQELQAGRLRNGQNVLAVSSRWKTLESKASQKKLAQKTGIRWSELNRLPYWDPVLNVSLGVMHNWFEGILQHHFRYRWGCELNEAKKVVNYEDVSSDEGNTMDVDDCDGSSNSESDGFDGFLPEPSKKKILAQIQEVVVPKGITRIPVQLGAAKAGKLKASEWHALFGIYLPLASMDILWSSEAELTNDNSKLLINLCSLIQCTNILSRKSFTKADCIKFSQTYELYQKTSMDLFKEVRVNPNHHYATHFPDQIKLWGPPMGISEFGGERLIGALQGYKTNFLIGKMEQTMMKKFNQLQRLEQKTQLLTKVSRNGAGYKFEMKEETYNTVLQYLRRHKPNLRDYRDLPHPMNALILQNYSKSYRSIEWKLGLKISTLPPNNFIEYKDSNAKHFGKICYILDLVSKEIHSGPLLVVQCFEPVGGHKCGMLNSLLEEISVWHVKESHRLEIVPMEKIGSLAAVRTLPAWSLGISSVSFLIKPITNILDFTINL